MNELMYPKQGKKKKRKKHGKSILQDQSCKQCFLCMLLEGDFREKPVQDHHVFYGSGRRQKRCNGYGIRTVKHCNG